MYGLSNIFISTTGEIWMWNNLRMKKPERDKMHTQGTLVFNFRATSVWAYMHSLQYSENNCIHMYVTPPSSGINRFNLSFLLHCKLREKTLFWECWTHGCHPTTSAWQPPKKALQGSLIRTEFLAKYILRQGSLSFSKVENSFDGRHREHLRTFSGAFFANWKIKLKKLGRKIAGVILTLFLL